MGGGHQPSDPLRLRVHGVLFAGACALLFLLGCASTTDFATTPAPPTTPPWIRVDWRLNPITLPSQYNLIYSAEPGSDCEVTTDLAADGSVTETAPCSSAVITATRPRDAQVRIVARKAGLTQSASGLIRFLEAPQLEILTKAAGVLPNKSVTIRLAAKNATKCAVVGDTTSMYGGNGGSGGAVQTKYQIFGCDSVVVLQGSSYSAAMLGHYTITASNGDPLSDIAVRGEVKQEVWRFQIDSWSVDRPLVGLQPGVWNFRFRCEQGCFASATGFYDDPNVLWKGILIQMISPGMKSNAIPVSYLGPTEVSIGVWGSFSPGHYQWILSDQTGRSVTIDFDVGGQ